jgi:hypothetical protein
MKTTAKIHRMEKKLRLAKAKLRKLKESVEDLDDLLCLEKAKLHNAGKPLILWEEVAKELGIPAPRQKG